MRVTKFLENAAEILVAAAGSILFTSAAIEAGFIVDSPKPFALPELGVGMIGAFFSLAIIKGLIKDLKEKQTEDSFLQFDSKKTKLKK
jgi:hypothetical protein